MSSLTIWDQVLSRVEDQVGKHSFSTWFKPTSLLADGGHSLSIRVPNLLFVEWLPKHYSVVLAEALRDVGRPDVKLTFVPDPAHSRDGGKRSVSTPSPEFDRGPVEAGTAPPPEAEDIVADLAPQRAGSLIPRYTFDTFIVGPSNQFAHAACRAVAETPSRSYNPLFIHGGVGLGKTHLMHAIGHYVVQHHPGLVLTYISSERFMNEMINALRFDRILDFRSRYRSVDVLLVDDIQFVSGKEGTQNEFFHTFNALHDAQKQIVISSDRPPHEIPALEERLRSRFEWGLIADIQPPDLETKMAILDKKAETEGVRLPDDVRSYIATKTKSNVRELEGALTRLIAVSSLTGAPITVAMAQQTLKYMGAASDRRISIDSIIRAVADKFGLSPSQLKMKSNTRQIAFPRQIAMYLCKELTRASLPEIGRAFGGKHHTTVLHSIQKIEDLRQRDEDLNRLIQSLFDTLQ